MGMFSTTPAESSLVAKKSWKLFKISFVRSQQRSDLEIDYMQYGLLIARVCVWLRLNTVLSGSAYQWTTDGHHSIWSILTMFAQTKMVGQNETDVLG